MGGASSLADDDDIDLAEPEKPQASKSHDPRDMIYDHVRWFDLEANDRHSLLEERRRQIPVKAGDAKDASTMAWRVFLLPRTFYFTSGLFLVRGGGAFSQHILV